MSWSTPPPDIDKADPPPNQKIIDVKIDLPEDSSPETDEVFFQAAEAFSDVMMFMVKNVSKKPIVHMVTMALIMKHHIDMLECCTEEGELHALIDGVHEVTSFKEATND